ncbi:hypothetical protein [Pseudomonas sp. LRF_L74]|uniref:hypothetical protein n=1 Tax=Pseudomonas sp. LRF_L74 TaxID=3369422 RepID=UPI003F5F2392
MSTDLQTTARVYLTARLHKMERASIATVRERMLTQIESQAELLAALSIFSRKEADMLYVHARDVYNLHHSVNDAWHTER